MACISACKDYELREVTLSILKYLGHKCKTEDLEWDTDREQ